MSAVEENRKNDASREKMTFWEHLEALRGVLWRAVAVWLLLAVACFALMPRIFDSVILAPCRADFPTYILLERIAALWPGGIEVMGNSENFHVELINVELASQFFIHISTSCWMSLVVALPLVLYLLWGFLRPALYPAERRRGGFAFLMGYLMFCIGMAISYFVVFPLTVRFLAGYELSPDIPNVISITSYVNMFVSLLLVMGLLFELPLLAWVLGRFGLLTRAFFNRYRRYAIVALLTLAAVVTPTGDPFTLLAVFIPVYFVWELGAVLVPK